MYSAGIGKAILAAMDEKEWPEHISSERVSFTPNTLTDYDRIIAELKRTRERGYAIDNAEKEMGVRCVGVPVLDKKGSLVGGISVSGPADQFDSESIPKYAALLHSAVVKMQERLYH